MGVDVYAEDDLLPISALQHLLFCPRQCALIHVERLWAENSLTREGRHLHEKADGGRGESRGGGRIARGLLLRSFELGLFGKADVVEFRPAATGVPGLKAQGLKGSEPASRNTPHAKLLPEPRTLSPSLPLSSLSTPPIPSLPTALCPPPTPFPIEYKRGKPKKDSCDEVQLCAQALCLEEMLGVAVPAGALFYGKTRRRTEVAFDPRLRGLTVGTIQRLHELIASRRTPSAVYEKKCDRCSLRRLCLPDARPGTDAASRYLRRAMAGALAGAPGSD
jgi:CRISPR-associated exonuclease Cas4